MYPPACFFMRIGQLDSFCKEATNKDERLVTYVRSGFVDIELYETRVGDSYWMKEDLEKYDDLPEPMMKLKWIIYHQD